MPHWLSQISSEFCPDKSLLIAAVCDVTGASPDGHSSLLVLNQELAASNIINDVRRDLVIADAKRFLTMKKAWTEITYPLGKVMTSANGECHVVYQYFERSGSCSWLRDAETIINAGKNAWLAFRKNVAGGSSIVTLLPYRDRETLRTLLTNKLHISTDAARALINHNFDTTQLFASGHDPLLLLPVRAPSGPVIVVGRHRVALEIIRLFANLPINVHWIADEFTESDPDGPMIIRSCSVDLTPHIATNCSVVIIMSNDHRQDYKLCEQALQHPVVDFVGCIGSTKKTALVKRQLLSNGISDATLKKLHMPVGLPAITGKHPALIATSVVAQILTVYQPGSDDQLTLLGRP